MAKYLWGRGRLINGLEIGLKGVKKYEKFRLIVSAKYGYGNQSDISIIPADSKLVFEL